MRSAKGSANRASTSSTVQSWRGAIVMFVTVYRVVGPKKALPNVAGHLQASGMAIFRAAPEPVNLEPLIQSTMDWLDRRARADGSTNISELPPMFRWGFCLWPARCLICSCAADLRYLDLCRRCLQALPFKASSSREMVPLNYEPPVDEGLRALKFHGDWRWAAVFGALLAGWSQANGVIPVSLLVPMPLHPLRKAERGFNQAAQIARFTALWLGVAVDQRCLVRARPTRPQTSLSAAGRRDNVEALSKFIRRRCSEPSRRSSSL